MLTKMVENFVSKNAFGWKVRSSLYRHLSIQISNEREAISALEDFKKRMLRKKKKNVVRVLTDIIRRMQNGSKLSDAIGDRISQDESMMISSGELSGKLPAALNLVMETKERVQRVNRSIKSAMVAPIIYLVAVYGFLWGIGKFVVPSLAATLPPEKAQGMVSILYSLGAFFTSWWSLVPIVVLFVSGIAIWWSFPIWTGPIRVKFESYFPWSFYRDIQGYSWLLSFSSMLQAGMPDVDILKLQIKQVSPWMKERLVSAAKKMQNGDSLSMALLGNEKTGFGFPNPDMIDDIASMTGFPDFGVRITRGAIQWADEIERTISANAKTFGFAVEMIMYGIMGFLMVAINSMSSQVSTSI